MNLDFSNLLSNTLNPQFIYVLLSAVVAVLIYIEGEILKKTEGKMPQSRLFHISSVFDSVWFFISLAALYLIEFQTLALAVPTAYGIYTLAGWIYGSKLLRKNGIPDDPKDLVIPLRYVAFSQSFALIFFSLCLMVLSLPWLAPAELN